jgi:hypothetical protein
MSREMENLVKYLKANPGYVYINPDGTHMFALVGPEEKLMVAMSPKNFNEMTENEINVFIQNLLK